MVASKTLATTMTTAGPATTLVSIIQIALRATAPTPARAVRTVIRIVTAMRGMVAKLMCRVMWSIVTPATTIVVRRPARKIQVPMLVRAPAPRQKTATTIGAMVVRPT